MLRDSPFVAEFRLKFRSLAEGLSWTRQRLEKAEQKPFLRFGKLSKIDLHCSQWRAQAENHAKMGIMADCWNDHWTVAFAELLSESRKMGILPRMLRCRLAGL